MAELASFVAGVIVGGILAVVIASMYAVSLYRKVN